SFLVSRTAQERRQALGIHGPEVRAARAIYGEPIPWPGDRMPTELSCFLARVCYTMPPLFWSQESMATSSKVPAIQPRFKADAAAFELEVSRCPEQRKSVGRRSV